MQVGVTLLEGKGRHEGVVHVQFTSQTLYQGLEEALSGLGRDGHGHGAEDRLGALQRVTLLPQPALALDDHAGDGYGQRQRQQPDGPAAQQRGGDLEADLIPDGPLPGEGGASLDLEVVLAGCRVR